VVVFDSLTALLTAVEVSVAARFVSVLLDSVHAADGVAHVCLDPTAHDEETIATIAALFDGVATPDGDEWVVHPA
jgi:hypothetical protein